MNRASSVALSLLLLTLAVAVPAACRSGEAPAQEGDEAILASPDLVILDVRTAPEYAGGHIPDSILVPVDTLDHTDKLPEDKATPIVTYCAVGARAGAAKRLLTKKGYTRVINGGGLRALAERLGVEPVR
jgi:phage shock protein E